jgi:phosphatidate phosphatase APP1
MSWEKVLAGVISGIDDLSDKLRFGFRKKMHLLRPVQVCCYRSYGSEKEVHVRGRVLEDKGIKKAAEHHTIWHNIRNMARRFSSEEVPGAKLRIYFQGQVYDTVSDKEGYFYFHFTPAGEFPEGQYWIEAEVELVDSPIPAMQKERSKALIYLPPADAEFGIISDIDDTVIESFATRKLKMFRNLIVNNARTRMQFEGVSAFYKALQLGPDGKGLNPLFYVSASPWNLYDFLIDFLAVNDIPYGPLLLRDAGIEKDKLFVRDHRSHKYAEIERILKTYPKLPFILIGDSGQKDPVIYHEVVKRFPDRILSVYIRDIKLPKRAKVVMDLAQELKSGKTPMILIENTEKAAEHAIQNGFIQPEQMPEIQVARMVDHTPKPAEVKKPEPEKVKEQVKDMKEVREEVKADIDKKEEAVKKEGITNPKEAVKK